MNYNREYQRFSKFCYFWSLKFFYSFSTVWDLSKKLVKHNTLIPTELQSCKFKYSFLTRIPRKVFDRFSKFCFFGSLNFFCPFQMTTTTTIVVMVHPSTGADQWSNTLQPCLHLCSVQLICLG